jgi:hypothetical protein
VVLLHNAENTETRLSENGICLTQQMCHKIILFRHGSTIKDESKVLNCIGFPMKGILKRLKDQIPFLSVYMRFTIPPLTPKVFIKISAPTSFRKPKISQRK